MTKSDLTDLSPTQAEALAQIAEIIDRHFPERPPLNGKPRPRLEGGKGTGL